MSDIIGVLDDSYEEDHAEPMTQEDVLENEQSILAGLLEASNRSETSYRKIKIQREGDLLFSFRIRPLTEDEYQSCVRRATKYAPTKRGQPKKAIDSDYSKARSYMIYTATVDEDRMRVWENKTALDKLNLLQGVDMIDRVLLAGEKEHVVYEIEQISGYSEDMEEMAAK